MKKKKDSTVSERVRRYTQRAAERGEVYVKVLIPESRRKEIHILARQWRDENRGEEE